VAGNITWRVQGEFRTGNVGTGRASVSLQDAYIRWTRNTLGVQIGQFKTPFTREFITSLAEVETADRATVVDSLAPKRDIGLMADYAIGGRVTISAGIFNGEGQNVTANTDSSALGVVRVTYRPIPYLVLGANAARYFADSTRYGVDASVEAPWVIFRGEYIGQHRDLLDNGDDKGWYTLAAAPVRPWLQPVLKYEWFERGIALGTSKNGAWTAGVNLFPWGRTTRLTLEYVSREIGDPGVRKSLGLAQAQVIF
jgi:phosphate-selective porin